MDATESGGWVFSQYVPWASNTRTVRTVKGTDSPAQGSRFSEVGLSLPGDSHQGTESYSLSDCQLDWMKAAWESSLLAVS